MAWARLWEKRVWADYEHLLRSVFGVKKISKVFFESTIASALKSGIIILLKKFLKFFWGVEKSEKNIFFRAKNAPVGT